MILDVHLMIEDPDKYAPIFIQAGADQVSVHQEACRHLDRTLRMIRSEGAKAGVVINPATPVAMLDEVLDVVDYVLVMSVNPGFGGPAVHSQRAPQGAAAGRAAKGTGIAVPHRDRRWRNQGKPWEDYRCRGGVGGGGVVYFSHCESAGRF